MRRVFLPMMLTFVLNACGKIENSTSPPISDSSTTLSSKAERLGAEEAELGGLWIYSKPAPAFVFVEGRFMGETAVDQPLKIVRTAGLIHLRIACPHYGDGIYKVDVPAKEILSVQAQLTDDPTVWDYPDHDVPIGPGQELRGVILKVAGKIAPVRYVESIDTPLERILCIVKGSPEARVLDPEGKSLAMEFMPAGIEGAPGNKFFRLKLRKPGPHTLEVGGRPGGYSLRWMNGIPPLSGSDMPGLKRHRKAPESFGPK